MPQNPWPEWLSSLGFPADGVGDLQDLKFHTGVGDNGRWVGFINPGWYYHLGVEQYNYVLRGQQILAATAGSGVTTHDVSFRPAWGPVLLTGTGSAAYSQHHNSLQPACSAVWASAAAGALLSTTIPASTLVIGVRDLTTTPLAAMNGSGSLIGNKTYWYDKPNSKLYIKHPGSTTPNVFLDLMEFTPRLRVRELVVQKADTVRPTAQVVEALKIIRGYQLQHMAGPVSGALTHTLTNVNDGDWVVLEYNIPGSYCMRDHRTIHYWTSLTSGDVVYVHHETSVPDLVPNFRLTTPSSGFLNLNPMFSDSVRAGYIAHGHLTSPLSSYWTVGEVYVGADVQEVCGTINMPVKFLGMVLDKQGLPLPYCPTLLTYTSGCSAVIKTPSTDTTDGRGEIHALIQCPSGVSSFQVNVICMGVTGSVVVTNTQRGAYLLGDQDQECHLVVGQYQTPSRYPRMYACVTSPDGVPLPNKQLFLHAERASRFELGSTGSIGSVYVTGVQTVDNPFSIAGLTDAQQLGYLALAGDRVVATRASGLAFQSRVLEAEQ